MRVQCLHAVDGEGAVLGHPPERGAIQGHELGVLRADGQDNQTVQAERAVGTQPPLPSSTKRNHFLGCFFPSTVFKDKFLGLPDVSLAKTQFVEK